MTIKIGNEKDMNKFIQYYIYMEKPRENIIRLLNEILKKRLFEKVNFILNATEEKKIIYIQPNGIIVWDEMDNFDSIHDSCINYITSSKEVVHLHLLTRKELEEEKQKKTNLKNEMMIGPYALEILKQERIIEKEIKGYKSWKDNFNIVIKNKINDVLDRYNIQKNLYTMFHQERYKNRMKKWEKVFFNLSSLLYF